MPKPRGAASTLHDRVSRCRVCGNFADAQPCGYCRNQSRDDAVLCVVEDPADIEAVEKAKIFNGRYHVLAASLSPLTEIRRKSAAWPACSSVSATATSKK